MPTAPPVRLLAAGRLAPEKGFDVLIEAVRIAVASGLDLHLEVVGSGPERARLVAAASELGGRVTFTPPSRMPT